MHASGILQAYLQEKESSVSKRQKHASTKGAQNNQRIFRLGRKPL